MPVPNTIINLVERFDNHKAAYKGGHFNETQTRRELIDPFFEALGWDMTHTRGCPREVIHEDIVRVADRAKAPDYGFYLDNRRQFFVEAKQPSVNLADNLSPAFQLRRYGWSAKLPVSILTDFEEFAVYDTRKRPNAADKATTNRLLYLNYTDYPARWDEIASVFGRDAVIGGSLEQFAIDKGGKHSLAAVQVHDCSGALK